MRVIQAMSGARRGGAELFFERLVTALHRAGAEQLALVRHRDRAARLISAGVAVERLPFGGALDLVTRPRFAGIAKRWRPEIVLTWMSRATRLCPRGEFVHVARLGGYYDLSHYRACDHLVGNTRDLVAWFVRQGWPAERTHYLPNFVDAAPGRPLDRALFATPAEAPLALALGRLHRNKGFDVLLEALARVPALHLWIAGEGPEGPALRRHASRLGVEGRVRFLGWRDDTADLMASADLLVCSSRHEPLGNVVLEAWARGLPVAAAASLGPAALIAQGDSGLLAPVDDAAGLAAAMRRLAEEPALRARLAAGGRAAFAAEFTEAEVVRRYRDFFAAVAR
jgi:glycosyltransferase involved in cell wall biosynthesis